LIVDRSFHRQITDNAEDNIVNSQLIQVKQILDRRLNIHFS
jgi:hypothetical protein